MKKVENNAREGRCGYAEQCGGCDFQGTNYKKQLQLKQQKLEKLLGAFAPIEPIIGMKTPYFYRNKVHHAFTKDRSGNIISGPYENGSHWIINVDRCMIEDEKCQEVMDSVRELVKKFRIPLYNEKTEHGVLRRVLVRRAAATGEIMVVLVVGSSKFNVKKEFAAELKKRNPEIVTIISNLNDKRTSMVLGEKEEVLFGPGYIQDELCGLKFRISPKSFYQVNHSQTRILYDTAMKLAGLSGNETVLDAYCGIGTIGLCAASHAGKVIGVELNPDAVRDARINAEINNIKNAVFFQGDAGEFMKMMAAKEERADIVFMDPPRSGSTIGFMKSAVRMEPEKIVYISCGPESLARNLNFFKEQGYTCRKIQPVDMFPFTQHVETVVLLS